MCGSGYSLKKTVREGIDLFMNVQNKKKKKKNVIKRVICEIKCFNFFSVNIKWRQINVLTYTAFFVFFFFSFLIVFLGSYFFQTSKLG